MYSQFTEILEVVLRVNGTCCDHFLIQVRLHQGSVLSPLFGSVLSPLFIKVLEVQSREIKSGCPEELLYADDLALVSGLLEGLKGRLEAWKGALEPKGLRVNVKGCIRYFVGNKAKAESQNVC